MGGCQASRVVSRLVANADFRSSTIPDPDAPQSPNQFSAQDRQEYLEEINGELAIHLAILYFMVEVFRGDETWASELS